MKVALAWLACTAGCGFHALAVAEVDAGDNTASDAGDTSDAPIDVAAPPARTRAGLIGLWELDETSGLTINDTSDATPKVPLTVVPPGSVTFAASSMTPNGIVLIESTPVPHLNVDVTTAGAVTLEAWVMPAAANQGSLTAPVVVAGLSASILSRNISIMQAGKRWLARVRTTTGPNGLNGQPDLISNVDITAGVMAHLVVVDDATQWILYVDGTPDAIDPIPGPPLGWDGTYRMLLGNEISQNRQWAGSFALVAMFNQALTQALVETNHRAGPDGH